MPSSIHLKFTRGYLILLIALGILIIPKNGLAQISDSSLIKKFSINNLCLCKTTIVDMQGAGILLKPTSVEEMDLPTNCYGHDSRFISGKGYYSETQPGIILQMDQQSNYFSKIRLTKQFKGKLPDGNFIDLSNFSLKELFKLYPQFKNKWGSRDCSNYWNFSNDTLSFYVKIDKNKKPQFPIDEAYYMDKPIEAVDLVAYCSSLSEGGDHHIAEINTDPVFFMDSVRIPKSDLTKFDPNDISSVTVYKDTSAIKILGQEAKYGLIYIETKTFAKHRYWTYFRSKSPEYAKLITSPEGDSNIQYIINKRVLKGNYEGDLSIIDDHIFKGIKIIDKQQLIHEYGVTDKEYGVIISSNIPENLHNGKYKF
jgi:hypothetical protein